MKKTLTLSSVALAAALVLAACGDAPDEEGSADGDESTPAEDTGGETGSESGSESASGGATGASSDTTACMVSDQGGFDDQSFNQSGAEGLQEAVDTYGIGQILVESQTDADYTQNVDSLISQGCNLVFGVGFLLENAIEQAANDNPDVSFALIDSGFQTDDFQPVELENGRPLIFDTVQAAFLAGYASAGMSETGIVATFGGIQLPSVTIFMDGFALGVDAYNEDNGTDVAVLGWDEEAQEGSFTGNFEDQGQGQTLADQFIAQGADIIMPVAGPVGLGAAAAAESAGDVMIVGVDSDWYESTDYGDIVLTSVLKEIGQSVVDTVGDYEEDSFDNTPYVGTLENGGVSIAPFHDFEADVPSELVDRLAELEEEIISGERTVESVSSPQQ
ncbi:BMP family lipoprotein [Georgenia sp. Z1344]|uniref:BMP family lipoprotein n=1 Tax=Georgenia sp. Z1344 TaxID=3416706 RepID=UPI003CE81A23